MDAKLITEGLTNKLRSDIPALMAHYAVPGLSLVLLREAKVFWKHAFGVHSSDTQKPVTLETLFEAASLSKPVFAYAVLKACEDGIIDLDTPLVEYLPEPYLPDEPRANLITARHVLCHTPGFPNWRPEGKKLRMHALPGQRFSYSGDGYMYLQATIAQVTAQEPVDFMQANLLEQLKMVHSQFIWRAEDIKYTAIGHDDKGQAEEKRLWPKMSSASSLHCTPTDFAIFMCAVMDPTESDPVRLGPEITREMLTAQVQVDAIPSGKRGIDKLMHAVKDTIPNRAAHQADTNPLVGWGLGWGTQSSSNGESFWHWGDNGNFRAFAVGYPKDGHGIVIMTNGKNGQSVIDRILYDMIGGDYPGLDWLNGSSG